MIGRAVESAVKSSFARLSCCISFGDHSWLAVSPTIACVKTVGIETQPALSILNDMRLENTPEALPPLAIKLAIFGQTIDGRVSHVQRVVRVIMRKQTLATKGEQSIRPS